MGKKIKMMVNYLIFKFIESQKIAFFKNGHFNMKHVLKSQFQQNLYIVFFKFMIFK